MADNVFKLHSREARIAHEVIRYINQIIKPMEEIKLIQNAIKSELIAAGYNFPELKKAAKAIWDLKAPEQRQQAELFVEYASPAIYELVLEQIGKSPKERNCDRDPNTEDWIDGNE